MLAVAIEHKGWMGTIINIITGETPEDIVKEMFGFQNFSCLVNMGYENEPERRYPELKKIEKFIELYTDRPDEITLADIADFSYKLSAGSMRCLGTAENSVETEKLKKKYPDAMIMEA